MPSNYTSKLADLIYNDEDIHSKVLEIYDESADLIAAVDTAILGTKYENIGTEYDNFKYVTLDMVVTKFAEELNITEETEIPQPLRALLEDIGYLASRN